MSTRFLYPLEGNCWRVVFFSLLDFSDPGEFMSSGLAAMMESQCSCATATAAAFYGLSNAFKVPPALDVRICTKILKGISQ